MKASLILFTLLAWVSIFAHAQRGPLRGSGKIIVQSFDFEGFDKINFEDLDGTIEVEVGKIYAIKIGIDDNLQSLLSVKKESREGMLNVSLEGNTNNKMYIEDTHIHVKITLPEASVIAHRGNSRLQIRGIAGRYFRLENSGNGNATLQGSIDMLDIKKDGNGEVNAQSLVAKTAKISSYGNGNVKVNAQISLTVHGTGNGNVVQFGSGKVEPMSGIVGNGQVRRM